VTVNEYLTAPNRLVTAANGIDYAYRDIGDGTRPLVLLQHFRRNLDNWDPALIDALASGRRVVTFDNAGVGGSTGTTPVIGAVGGRTPNPDGYLSVFFTPSTPSRQSGMETLGRMTTRTENRDKPTSWQTRHAQYDAVCAWGVPNHAVLQRPGAIDMPVLVTNGDSDPMIRPHYSYLLAGLMPHAQVKIYPNSAHGFLFQQHAAFARDVKAFLSAAPR
jgi:pimeloyl-ACP methyl ester carboxylesterase